VALVGQLKDSGVDGDQTSMLVASDDVTMKDIVRPRRSVVHIAAKEMGGGGRLWGSRAAEGGGSEEAEVMTAGAPSFDDHKVLVLALDSVDRHDLEQVQLGV
jgi:hypothetical protein